MVLYITITLNRCQAFFQFSFRRSLRSGLACTAQTPYKADSPAERGSGGRKVFKFKSRSKRKAKSSRRNGRLGGRPRSEGGRSGNAKGTCDTVSSTSREEENAESTRSI